MVPVRTPSQRSSRSLERLKAVSPEQAIPHLLKSLQHSLRQVVDERLRKEGINVSFAHFVTLYFLEEEPGLSGAELARRAFVTAQTSNTILRRLESEGQVERRPNPQHTRTDSWFVTRKGQGQLDRSKVVGAKIWSSMLSTLAPRELTQLQNYLQRCLVSIDSEVAELSKKPARKVSAKRKAAARKAPVRGQEADFPRSSRRTRS